MDRDKFFDMMYRNNEEARKEIHTRWSEIFNLTEEQSVECEKRAKDELNGRNLGELEIYMNKENIKKRTDG